MIASGLVGGPAVFEVSGLPGVARAAAVAVLAYAILRHQLLDIDVRVKWTIRRGTLAALFLAVFFIVASIAQNYLSASYGILFGGVATGVMLFALAPLQRVAERVANTAMPDVKPVESLTGDERAALYREQLALAYGDGHVTADERVLLDHLRRRLSIDAEHAMTMESDEAARHAQRAPS
jgi:hypothetical protein